MKNKKILIILCVVLVIALCLGTTACGSGDGDKKTEPNGPTNSTAETAELNISNKPHLFFTREMYDTEDQCIAYDKLPISTEKPMYMHLDFAVSNTSDKESILKMEILLEGTDKIEVTYLDGHTTNADVKKDYLPQDETIPTIKLFNLNHTIGANETKQINYIIKFIVADALKNPIDVKVKVDFNLGGNVQAKGYQNYPINISYVIDKMIEQPKNIKLVNDKLVWDNVENNCGYILTINDEDPIILDKDVTNYDISGLQGEYAFKLQTVADGRNLQNSLVASLNNVTISKLQSPELRMNIENDRIDWDPIDGATSYLVTVNDSTIEVINHYFTISTLNSDTKITVVAKSTVNGVLQSNPTNEMIIKKLASPVLGETLTRITWEAVEGATCYKVYVDGVYNSTITECSFKKIPGTKKISVQACNDTEGAIIFNSTKAEIEYKPIA